MEKACEKVDINGQEYVKAELQTAKDDRGRQFVIIRSYGAGVFTGYVKEWDRKNRVVVLDECIRLHRWTGCSLSQVANDGTAGTGKNRFSMPTNDHEILEVVEKISCTEKARKNIQGVKTWKL